MMLLGLAAGQDPAPRPAQVKGRVVDSVTGAPLPRAIVSIRAVGGPGSMAQATTSGSGHFEFAALAPASYTVSATSGEFRVTHVLQETPKPIQLQHGETREITIAMRPALAISGRVVDDSGSPLAGVQVEIRPIGGNGRGIYFRRFPDTDDSGAFRLFGLPPGRYTVCAEGRTSPTFGTAPAKRELRFVRTCHAASADGAGEPVVLSETDIDGVEIRMQRRPTFTISGVVLDSSGLPAQNVKVGLSVIQGNRFAGTSVSGSSRVAPDGVFMLRNIVPAHYELLAEGPGAAPGTLEAAMMWLDIVNDDVTGLTLMTKKGVRLRGRVTFEDDPPPTFRIENLRVLPRRPTGSASGLSGQPGNSAVTPEGTFELTNVFGPFLIEIGGLPPRWVVRSVRYRGREIRDIATEFDGDPQHGVEIVLTSRTAEISGRATDDRGNSAADTRVLVFPTDRDRWSSWNVTSATASKEGAFIVRDLPPGDYFAVAVSSAAWTELVSTLTPAQEARRYGALAAVAQRLTLLENDRRTVELDVKQLPEDTAR